MLAALAASQAPARADELEDHAQYVAAVEQAKGHLLVSREVYRKGERVRAGVHASHPIQELGYRLWRPVTKVDPKLGAQVQAALKGPGRSVEAKAPVPAYDKRVDETLALLDRAVARAVPAQRRGDPTFQARVLQTLLVAIDEEYGEAIAQGRVVLEIEYQDAWGFFQRLRPLWADLRKTLAPSRPDVVTAVDQQMEILGRAFPGFEAPATPVAVETVAGALNGMTKALAPLAMQGR
jgi:hypothetical protein